MKHKTRVCQGSGMLRKQPSRKDEWMRTRVRCPKCHEYILTNADGTLRKHRYELGTPELPGVDTYRKPKVADPKVKKNLIEDAEVFESEDDYDYYSEGYKHGQDKRRRQPRVQNPDYLMGFKDGRYDRDADTDVARFLAQIG